MPLVAGGWQHAAVAGLGRSSLTSRGPKAWRARPKRLSCLLERGQRVARAVERGPLRKQASKAFLRAPPGCA